MKTVQSTLEDSLNQIRRDPRGSARAAECARERLTWLNNLAYEQGVHPDQVVVLDNEDIILTRNKTFIPELIEQLRDLAANAAVRMDKSGFWVAVFVESAKPNGDLTTEWRVVTKVRHTWNEAVTEALDALQPGGAL